MKTEVFNNKTKNKDMGGIKLSDGVAKISQEVFYVENGDLKDSNTATVKSGTLSGLTIMF